MNPTPSPQKFFKTACLFEGSLVIVAIILGWIADINPFQHLRFTESALIHGILGTLPVFLFFMTLQYTNLQSIARIRRLLLETIAPAMKDYGWADLLVLAAIAGFTEELLFRGVIQPWLENSWGFNAALIISNLILGLVHAVTFIYAVLAFLIGIYLGIFLDYGGERNLLTPIIIHGLYDFLAFIVILKTYKKSI